MDKNFPTGLPGFDPIRRIGSGGFGDVWLAEQSGFDRNVAIKVSQRPLETTDEKLRFERECKALGRLSGNPNIVGVYTSGLVNNTLPYLVMEYIDGGTLKSQAEDLNEADVRRIMGQLCLALQAAHDVGVLHRDLKPENVFLRTNGDPVVGDFGIARVAESGQTSTGVPATLLYVAPEILEGEEPTPLSDVYGIGVTIASVLLGRSPFAANDASHASIIARVLQGEPASLKGLGFSPALVSLVETAMARNPDDRPSSAKELNARLVALGSSEPNTTAPQAGVDVGRPEAKVSGALGDFEAGAPKVVRDGSEQAGVSSRGVVANVPPVLGPPPSATPQPSFTRPEKGSNLVLIGLLAVAAALVFVGGAVLVTSVGGDGQANGAESSVGSQDTSVSTTIVEDVAGPEVSAKGELPAPPTVEEDPPPTVVRNAEGLRTHELDLPLGVESVASATGLGVTSPGFIDDRSPANNQLFCGNRPVVDGLEQTVASRYKPSSSYIVSQRVARFSSEPDAIRHAESFVALLTCASWSSGPQDQETVFSAVESSPEELFGNQLFQIDEEALLPSGGTIFSRVIIVRRDNDVLRVSYSSPNKEATTDGANKLLAEAVDRGGF